LHSGSMSRPTIRAPAPKYSLHISSEPPPKDADLKYDWGEIAKPREVSFVNIKIVDPFVKSLGRVFQEVSVEETLIIQAIHECIEFRHWDYGASASGPPNANLAVYENCLQEPTAFLAPIPCSRGNPNNRRHFRRCMFIANDGYRTRYPPTTDATGDRRA
jgi:hypothetical protein